MDFVSKTASATRTAFPGLDDDLCDYIVSMLVEYADERRSRVPASQLWDNDAPELAIVREQLVAMLVSAECADSEDAASQLCDNLVRYMRDDDAGTLSPDSSASTASLTPANSKSRQRQQRSRASRSKGRRRGGDGESTASRAQRSQPPKPRAQSQSQSQPQVRSQVQLQSQPQPQAQPAPQRQSAASNFDAPTPLLHQPIRLDSMSHQQAGGDTVHDGEGGVAAADGELMGEHAMNEFLWGRQSGFDSGAKRESTRASVNSDIVDRSGTAPTARQARREAKRAAAAAAAEEQRKREEAEAAEEDLRLVAGLRGRCALSDLADSAKGTAGTDAGTHVVVGAQDVHVENFDMGTPGESGRLLLEGATLRLARGHCYGLVGRNGTGKTTLLRAIADRSLDNAAVGHVPPPECMSIVFVKHEVPASAQPVLARVLSADAERTELMAEQAELEARLEVETFDATLKMRQERALERLNEVLARLEAIGAPTAPARASAILRGLGFDAEAQQEPTSRLSGGWRMRVALATALFLDPDLLLLDEPTTHLDLEAVLWLEHFLDPSSKGPYVRREDATTVVVSHDRHFLNAVCTDVVRLDHRRRKLQVYKGAFDDFVATRAAERLRTRRAREAQEEKRKHLQRFIDKNSKAARDSTKIAKQRKSKMRALERVGLEAAAEAQGRRYKASYDVETLGEGRSLDEVVREEDESDDEHAQLRLPDPGSIGKSGPIVRADGVGFSYGGRGTPLLFRDLDISVDEGSRIALLGPNGAGKTTLLRVLTGALQPTEGNVSVSVHARIECIDQHQVEQLDVSSSPLQYMLSQFPPEPGHGVVDHEKAMRRHLGRFGVSGGLATQRIRTLSGGQRCRVVLARAMYKRPHVIVMDEPTNYLDLETVEALIVALSAFKGGVLLVSHDQHFIDSVVSEHNRADPTARPGQLLLVGGGDGSGGSCCEGGGDSDRDSSSRVRVLERFEQYRREVMARVRARA